MLDTAKSYLSKAANYVTPTKNTMIGATQVATVILGPLLGHETARYLSETDMLPDNVIGELLSGSSDYMSERVFKYTLIGGFSLGSFLTANWLEQFKDGNATAGVDLDDLDIEEDLQYFNIDTEDPSPKELRDLIRQYQSMREEFDTMRIDLSRYRSQDEDIMMQLHESGIDLKISSDAELSGILTQLIKYAEGMQSELNSLPKGVKIVDDGIVVSRDGERGKQTFDELLSSVIGGIELSKNKSNLSELNSQEFYAEDAAHLFEAIAVCEGLDAASKYAEGDDRATLEEARQNVEANLEEAMNA